MKWEKQEKLFVAALTVLLVIEKIGYVYHRVDYTKDALALSREFMENFLIQITPFVFLFLCYLGITRYLVPVIDSLSWKAPLKDIGRQVLKINGWWFIFSYLLGPINNFSLFYLGITYKDFPSDAFFHPQPFRNLFGGMNISFSIVLLYSAYAFLRKAIIQLIHKTTTRIDYRLQILNLVTTFFFLFLTVAYFYKIFRYPEIGFWVIYLVLIPSVFLMSLCCIYWVFPLNKNNSFFSFKFAKHFLLALVISMLPALFMETLYGAEIFLTNLGILLLTLPITWAIYNRQADTILALRGKEKELVKSKADIQFLRSQINPHFLFNALNTLYGTAIVEKSERTAEGIQRLGDMMRFMLHDNHLDLIPMRREIGYLKNYIALQKLRIASSPEIIIENVIEEENCDHLIAPMLLIPFVENAFKHGISFRAPSWIKISLHCEVERIHFSVSNSIHLIDPNDPEKEASGIGIQNVKDRLNLLYPNQYEFTCTDDHQNFQITLSIPPKTNIKNA